MLSGTMKEMGRPKKKRGGPDDAVAGIAIRGSKKWHAWVLKLADERRLKVTDLIDQALVFDAKEHGFEDVPPKR